MLDFIEFAPPKDDAAQRLLIGESEPMRHLRTTIRRLAPADLPVLIVGPTGVGKELVARAIHAMSGRSGELVAFNVCAVADTMFEATLFGHVKGAFTGATTDAAGYMAEANGGSLFLDEVGSLTLPTQVKLLRALENGTYRPVGAARDRQSRFRVIAATNEELPTRVDAGAFRVDLYHRLGGVVVRVPTLRERPDDVLQLARHLWPGGDAHAPGFARDAADALNDYGWPGNVRELRNVVRRLALFLGSASTVTRELVRVAIDEASRVTTTPRSDGSARQRLLATLQTVGWNVAAAGERLGVDRATVYRWMRREGITVPPRRLRTDDRAEPIS